MDWRLLMKAQPSYTHYPQYPQKGEADRGFEDFGDIAERSSPVHQPESIGPPHPCRLCGEDSWWRSGPTEVWQCRRCHPLVRAPGYEVLGPYGKPGDAVRTQPRADAAAWLSAWCEVARLTDGITKEDLRFQLVMAALKPCDEAFERDDWLAFREAVAHVRLTAQTEHER